MFMIAYSQGVEAFKLNERASQILLGASFLPVGERDAVGLLVEWTCGCRKREGPYERIAFTLKGN